MKKILIAAAVGVLVASQVAAQESPLMVRARAVYVDLHNSDQVAHGALNLGVDNKTLPEIDISYFFNKNVAAEVILTTPQQGRVHTGTGSNLGSFKFLPPTLTMQYHFTDFKGYKPYVGAGLNFTKISNETLAGGYTLSQHSYGPALQAGVDIPLTKQVSLNLDVKKVYMKTDVYSGNGGTTNNGTLHLNPVLWGVGVGYRF